MGRRVARVAAGFARHAHLLLPALALVAVHTLTNDQYGFHRDELALLADARHLDWGFVAYPPLTPAVARVALDVFGPSLPGVRLFAALAQAVVLVLAGLMARDMGGGRFAQVVAALASASAPIALLQGAMLQYVGFDRLWWVVVAFCTVRLVRSENPRWWLGIGAAIGLGMLTKYTMGVLVAGLVVGVLLTPLRRDLAGRWPWFGALLAVTLALPNVIWQAQHDFVSLEFLAAIRARDAAIGRTDDFLLEQFLVCTSPLLAPIWIVGLLWCLFSSSGRRYRVLGWMYLVPLALFLALHGRSYYLAPAYPMLFAAGAVVIERWVASLRPLPSRLARGAIGTALLVAILVGGAISLPIAPVGSRWWDVTNAFHDNFAEQIGWPELVATVAEIYGGLPDGERARTAILTGNYGEAGAIDLYGPALGLPPAISGVNSYWARGYGDPPPSTVIVLGFRREAAERVFETCELAGRVTNRYGVRNEESRDHPEIFVCRGPRRPWPILWGELRRFG